VDFWTIGWVPLGIAAISSLITGSKLSNIPSIPDQRLVVQIPHGYVSVGAAGEADLGVGADGQSVARGRGRSQLGLDPRGRRGQVPDRQSARLAPDDESPAVRKQPTGADVVVSVLMGRDA